MPKKKNIKSGNDVVRKRKTVSKKNTNKLEVQNIDDSLLGQLKNYRDFFNFLLKPEEDELDLEFND